ncbi:MAG: Rne/Rng family ribonuclease [Flavobacteriales bacterium]|nr:Rne/Rng family ribonuclease [Flavobacteriales bacterium]
MPAKGPRPTTEITLAGRYLVLVPFSDRISMSKNIGKNGEKERLKRLLESIVPKGFGVIVRTVAEDKKVAQLDADLKELVKRWRKIHKNLKGAKPATRVLGELNRSSAILRDVMNASFTSIKVDNAEMAEELKDYIKIISPEKENIVKFYKGKAPLFESEGIEKQIKQSFGRHVTMKSGAYLVIEHTEALHVVDVNSGNTAKSKDDQETNALRVNLESAAEIGRQLKLRDMGGIIVVDFIDLQKAENRRKLHDKMREAMANDKAKHHILAPSKFGLVQITRQRVRPEMKIKTSEVCPSCKGTGEVQASVLIVDEIERNMAAIIEKFPDASISLEVHPFLEAFLKKGYPSVNMKWLVKFKKRYKIKAATSYTFLEYHFFDHDRNELKL